MRAPIGQMCSSRDACHLAALTAKESMSIFRVGLIVSAMALVVGPASLEAQAPSVRAAAGAAIPVGGAGERRDGGPAAVLSVETTLSSRWSLRVVGEWSLLRGPTAPAGQEHFSTHHDLRTLGVSLNGMMRLSDERLAPYLLVGAGAYRLQGIGDRASPYGTTGAVQAGFGLDSNYWSRVNPFMEARAQVHATDYGASDASATVYWPVVIGLRLQ
jgi:hypothetical protein